MDGDGAVVVEAGRAEEVLEAGRRREADEAAMMDELRAGALTLDLMGLREKLGVEGGEGHDQGGALPPKGLKFPPGGALKKGSKLRGGGQFRELIKNRNPGKRGLV